MKEELEKIKNEAREWSGLFTDSDKRAVEKIRQNITTHIIQRDRSAVLTDILSIETIKDPGHLCVIDIILDSEGDEWIEKAIVFTNAIG